MRAEADAARVTHISNFSLVAVVALVSSAFATGNSQTAGGDTRDAVPASQAAKLPKTEERYHALQQQMKNAKPSVESARKKSEALTVEAAQLRQQLVATAARVQALEQEKSKIDADILMLGGRERTMSDKFARNRVQVSHLIAILERLQSDLPPALALEPADALRSARGAMLLGAALPKIYQAAAEVSRQLKALKQTRASLLSRRAQSLSNAADLSAAEGHLDKLLAARQREASGAGAAYQALQAKFDAIANQATDLKTLLDRVSMLRANAGPQGMVIVSAEGRAIQNVLKPGSLASPVVGHVEEDAPGEERQPGLNFVTSPGAAVVAPADSHVLFAGPYRKTGQVLILETAGGYDLVLAGLDRVDVRSGDQLLAGEPVGRMPRGKNGAKLYFELRQNGKSVSPAAWLGIGLRKARKS
jgi:septal ring factor EnvC (AmiA/AmiB activator)